MCVCRKVYSKSIGSRNEIWNHHQEFFKETLKWNRGKEFANRTNERKIISLSLSLFVDAISLAECRKLLSPFHGWNWIESNHRALKYLKADFPFALVFILLHFHCRFSGTTASSPLRNKYQPGPHLTKSSAGKNIKERTRRIFESIEFSRIEKNP